MKKKFNLNSERLLLIILVAMAFFGFVLWSIQQAQSEEEALGNSNLVDLSNPLENKMIKVVSPKLNSEIKSPVAINGEANLSGNRLKARVKDDRGLILAETSLQTKDAKTMSAFSSNLKYKKSSTSRGVVEIFQVLAKDNSEIYKISIPVKFKD